MKVIFFILIASCGFGFGQAKPNLSGEWVIDYADSQVVVAGATLMGTGFRERTFDCHGDVTIEHSEPELVIVRKGKCLDRENKPIEFETTYRYFTDGRGEENSTQSGLVIKSETRWEKGHLKITEYQIDRSGKLSPSMRIKITISKKRDKLKMFRVPVGRIKFPYASRDDQVILIFTPRK